MKRMGVLGGVSPQATIDFEARVHRVAQRLLPQHWNRGYPPMLVWYHRHPPMRVTEDSRPIVPMQLDPGMLDGAAWLGKASDFLVIPCNSAHVGAAEIERTAGCPVLSMVTVTLDEVARRGWRRVGVMGFHAAPPLYVDPLRLRSVACEAVDAEAQARLDAAIIAVMEGRDGHAERDAVRVAVELLRARSVDGIVLGCTELPLLLDDVDDAKDLVNPAAVLAEAAVRYAMDPGVTRPTS
jgi:aspartate racemase